MKYMSVWKLVRTISRKGKFLLNASGDLSRVEIGFSTCFWKFGFIYYCDSKWV